MHINDSARLTRRFPLPKYLVRRAINVLGMRLRGGTESANSRVDLAVRVDQLSERAMQGLPPLRANATEIEQARHALASLLLEQGRGAMRELALHGESASLSAAQTSGLEAIVRLTGRPSLTIVGGQVVNPPAEWSETIQVNDSTISAVIPKVGRLRVPEFVDDPYLGTAFMVAPGLAMTNSHVAISFAERNGAGWKIGTGLTALVDFLGEEGSTAKSEFRVVGIELLHPDPNLDLAVLRLAQDNTTLPLPDALPLNKNVQDVRSGASVYVIGYPGADDRHEASVVEQVFGRTLGVKRLAPGEIASAEPGSVQFTHDCSTLRGNSGSGVFSLATGRLFGLHRAGTVNLENRAVSLAAIRQDEHLTALGIGA